MLTGNLISSLFYGTNGNGQNVFTWLANGNATEFQGNVAPLVSRLARFPTGPQPAEYIGYMSFGTETLYANDNVTFANDHLEIKVNGK